MFPSPQKNKPKQKKGGGGGNRYQSEMRMIQNEETLLLSAYEYKSETAMTQSETLGLA